MKRLLSLVLCLAVFMSLAISVSALKTVTVKGISLSKSSLTLGYGKTYDLKTTYNPTNTTQKLLIYSTSNKNVASIDTAGKITAVGVGKATITVTSSSNKKLTAKCEIIVPQIVLSLEHQDTEKPERAKYYDQLAAKYTKIHPDVKIEITKATFSTAQTTILTALSSGKPFDMFAAGVGDAKTWLSKNAIMDLTKYLYANNGEWINTFRPGVADMIKYGDGKIYNIPYYIDATPLCYHLDIFKKDNVQPAKTKKEFFDLCEKFKAEGYVPFQLHGSMGDDFLVALSLQFAAKYSIKPFDIVEGKVSFNAPWFKEALAVYKEMYVKGYLPKNFWTIGGTDGRMAYSQGKMVMKHGFFWDVDTHKDMGMPYENQGVASLPNFTEKEGIKLYKPVAVSSFMVSSKCKNPDVALDFLKFLTNTENQDDMAYKYFGRYPNGMPVVNKNVELSDYAMKYMDDMASGNGTVFVPTNVSLKYMETFSAKLPLFMEDKITLDELAAEFDKLRSK